MGDVAGTLPKALHGEGLDIRVIMPKHRGALNAAGDVHRAVDTCFVHMPWWVSGCAVDEARLPHSDVPIYFVEHGHYFDRDGIYGTPGMDYGDNLERFAFFCRSVPEVIAGLQWQPDVVHLNDWHTSLLALYQKSWDLDFRSVYTAHQLTETYHGIFPADQQPLAGIDLGRFEVRRFVREGSIDLARMGLILADAANTVSEQYAAEVAVPWSPEGVWDIVAERGDHFCGILNGVDYEQWNPATDIAIAAHFDAKDLTGKATCKAELQRMSGLPVDPDVPLMAMVTRLDPIKGLDLVMAAMPRLTGVQFLLLGSGDPHYADFFRYVAALRGDVAAMITFGPQIARQVYAGADMFLMPSMREPAGLAQMIALRYGTIPIVHRTGGLADTISEAAENQNGFEFHNYAVEDMLAAIDRAKAAYCDKQTWRALIDRAMACDHSWGRSAKRYVELYERALSAPGGR